MQKKAPPTFKAHRVPDEIQVICSCLSIHAYNYHSGIERIYNEQQIRKLVERLLQRPQLPPIHASTSQIPLREDSAILLERRGITSVRHLLTATRQELAGLAEDVVEEVMQVREDYLALKNNLNFGASKIA